jgi:predicted nucleic acid-binding protein
MSSSVQSDDQAVPSGMIHNADQSCIVDAQILAETFMHINRGYGVNPGENREAGLTRFRLGYIAA